MDTKIVIALYNTKASKKFRLYDVLIKYWQKFNDNLSGHEDDFYKYTHIELIVDGIWHTSASNEKGIVYRYLDDGYINGHWDFIEMYVTEKQKNSIREFFVKNRKDRYDWTAIFLARFFPFKMQDKNKWFCSEVVIAALSHAGVFKFQNKPFEYNVSDVPRELLRYGFSLNESEYKHGKKLEKF